MKSAVSAEARAGLTSSMTDGKGRLFSRPFSLPLCGTLPYHIDT